MSPKVSVIIPAFNAERFLKEAIESIRAQDVPTEILVVDDGSQDGTPVVAKACDHAVRCISTAHRGLSAARNTGLDASACDLVAFLDADDVWAPGKLENQCVVLERRREVDIVFGHSVEFSDGQDYPIREKPTPFIVASTMLARRSVFDRFGRFAEELEFGEFIDWYSRVKLQGASSAMLEQVVHYRRVHDMNMTRRTPNREGKYISVIRSHLTRKRRLDDKPNG